MLGRSLIANFLLAMNEWPTQSYHVTQRFTIRNPLYLTHLKFENKSWKTCSRFLRSIAKPDKAVQFQQFWGKLRKVCCTPTQHNTTQTQHNTTQHNTTQERGEEERREEKKEERDMFKYTYKCVSIRRRLVTHVSVHTLTFHETHYSLFPPRDHRTIQYLIPGLEFWPPGINPVKSVSPILENSITKWIRITETSENLAKSSRDPWSNCLINSPETTKSETDYYSGRQNNKSRAFCGRLGYVVRWTNWRTKITRTTSLQKKFECIETIGESVRI